MKKIITKNKIYYLDENRVESIYGFKTRKGKYNIDISFSMNRLSYIVISDLSEEDYYITMKDIRNFICSNEEILYLYNYEQD